MSVLLTKTLRSSTYNRALIWIGIFGTIVLVLFGYVYRSTSSYVLKPKSRPEAENAALRHQLAVLQRKVRGRVRLTNSDRLSFIQLYAQSP